MHEQMAKGAKGEGVNVFHASIRLFICPMRVFNPVQKP